MQDTPVHVEDLTGMENGLLFAELYGLPRAEALVAFATLFTSLGLDEALDVPTREYSYGMKKKLLIAEALVHNPDLLIVDEPALGLDPPSRAALLRILEECSEKGVCTLAATNEPALAQELAPHGIQVNAILPGNTATPMNENIRTEPELKPMLDAMAARTPSGRTYSEAIDMARAALFLASDDGRAMHGGLMVLDEGFSLGI